MLKMVKMKCLALDQKEFFESLVRFCKDKKTLKHIVTSANNKEILAISEICHNLLKGNIPCTPNNIKKMRKNYKSIRYLSDRNNSLKNRKKIIVKKGSGLILPLIPFAIAALSKLFNR